MYLFFHSEPYIDRSTESNNQGIKVQVKRTFKSYSFLSHTQNKTNKKKRWTLLEIFLKVECQCAAGASIPYFKINFPLFCCPLFFNPQVRINKKANKDCHLLPQYFRIALKDASSNISIDPIGLSSFHKFYFLTNLYIPLWLWKICKFMVFR